MKLINSSNSSAMVQFSPQSGGGQKQNVTIPAGSNQQVQLNSNDDYNVTATIDGNVSNQLNGVSNSTASLTISYKNGQVSIKDSSTVGA